MFNYFSHQIVRKATAVFGTLFNNVQIKRFDDSGDVSQTITVPLRYAPKTKWYSRVFEEGGRRDEFEGPDTAIRTPSMGFELTSMLYDTSRKLNRLNRIREGSVVNDSQISGYVGAPYNLDFSLYVFANRTADWTQIIEQIVPNFNPTLNVPVRMIHNSSSGNDIVQDVSVSLTDVSPDQNMYGDFRSRQTYTWTLSFTMKLDIFGSFDSPSATIGGAAVGGTDPAITVNFYNDENGELTLSPGQEPISVIDIPEI